MYMFYVYLIYVPILKNKKNKTKKRNIETYLLKKKKRENLEY